MGIQCYAPGNSFHYDTLDENGFVTIRREYKVGVNDDQLELIARIPHLKFLAIEASPVGDGGAVHFGGLRNLETLNLSTTAITDEAMETIARLPRLRSLDISRTEVTDRSLEQLGGCRSLVELNLEITKVTDAGFERLRKMLPGCEIQR